MKRLEWICVLLALAFAGAANAAATQYEYLVTYRGVFSLGKDMPIADLALHTPKQAAGTDVRETRLEVSSQAYSLVESLYPIRFLFRSWAETDSGYLVGFESFERARGQKHRLYLRDASDDGVQRFDLDAGAGKNELAELNAGTRPAAAVDTQQLFDRLGMLQLIRGKTLRDKETYRVPVTNGRERLSYRVKVEGRQAVRLAGAAFPAWKVRFDGLELAADGSEQPAHRPVFIWFSDDAEHIPLRVDARHAVGTFRIEWQPPAGLRQIARSVP